MGQKAPFELRELREPYGQLSDVDSFVVLGPNRLAIQRHGEPGFKFYTAALRMLSPNPVEAVFAAGNNLYPFRYLGKWGVADSMGKILIKPRFESVGWFREGKIALREKGCWGFANAQGKWIQKPRFHCEIEEPAPFYSEGFSVVYDPSSGGFRYLNLQGKFLGNRAYPNALPFQFGHAWVLEDQGFYLIDKEGKLKAGPYLDILYQAGVALTPVFKNDMFGFVDMKSATEVIPPSFFEISMKGPDAAVLTEQGWTILNSYGELCKSDYFEYLEAAGNHAFVFYAGEPGDRWAGLVNNQCSIEVPALWRYITAFREGFAVASANGETAFLIDTKGNDLLRERKYIHVQPPLEGFVVARNREEFQVMPVNQWDRYLYRGNHQVPISLIPLR